MATEEESNDEDNKLKELGRKFSELQSDRKTILERTRADNEELERITKLEQECIDEHLRSMQQTDQRVMKLESQLKQEKYENLKLFDRNINLKQSLDEAEKFSKVQKRRIAELESMVTLPEGKIADVSAEAQSVTKELQMLLSKTKVELKETRQRLSDVQEQLTVLEQVTAATQQRELQESGNSEQLQLELTPQHQPTRSNGISYKQILDKPMFALFSNGPIYSYFL